LEAASRLRPREASVWLALAQTYWKLHQSEPAQAAARSAEALTADPAILRGLAVYYSETSEEPKAAELLEAAIRRSPFDEGLYFDLAQLFLKQQNFAAALETLDAGRKYFDKSAQLELAAGVAYYGLRRFPEAIDAFLRTIQLAPGVEQPYVFLGRMLDQAEGKLPAITTVLAAFAARAPESYLSNFLYGKCLVLAGDPARAEALLRRSIALNDRFWESHFALGAVLEQRREFENATHEMQRAVELNPDDAASHYRLSRLYDRLGRTSEAQTQREAHARLLSVMKRVDP